MRERASAQTTKQTEDDKEEKKMKTSEHCNKRAHGTNDRCVHTHGPLLFQIGSAFEDAGRFAASTAIRITAQDMSPAITAHERKAVKGEASFRARTQERALSGYALS